jgi:hypothetical protein
MFSAHFHDVESQILYCRELYRRRESILTKSTC